MHYEKPYDIFEQKKVFLNQQSYQILDVNESILYKAALCSSANWLIQLHTKCTYMAKCFLYLWLVNISYTLFPRFIKIIVHNYIVFSNRKVWGFPFPYTNSEVVFYFLVGIILIVYFSPFGVGPI